MTTTPRTWVVGEVVTAAMLNTEIRDQWNSVIGAWTAYTPTLGGENGAPTLGNGTVTGKYLKIGRTVMFRIRLAWGSTTTSPANANWTFSLPAAPASSMEGLRIANINVRKPGTGSVVGSGELTTTSSGQVRRFSAGSYDSSGTATARPDNTFWDADTPFAPDSSTVYDIYGSYEAAS